MFINGVIHYLGSWESLNNEYLNQYIDIVKTLECINLEGTISRVEALRNIGRSGVEFFQNQGWERKPNGLLVKNKVGIQIYPMPDRVTLNALLFNKFNLATKENICELPILICLMEEATNDKLSMLSNFEYSLSALERLSPLFLNFPFLIIGISQEEKEIKVFEIPSELEGYNQNVIMNRSIEFTPEYYQAGLGILSYFHKILKEKYPNTQATVRIVQDDLVVKMIVETKDGSKHIVEKALKEYDLILKGEIKPEEYFNASSQIQQIIELNNELRMARVRIESQKELLAFQQNQLNENQIQINKLFELIGDGLTKPALPSTINFSPIITVENSLTQQTIISNEIKEAIEAVRALKEIVKSPETTKSLDEVDVALSGTSSVNDSAGMSKLQNLLEQVNKTESSVSKSIATTTAGVDLIKKLAGHYNKLAPWFGLPAIPFIK